jgi:ABC-type phosphate transport system substrate-binding protein
MALKEFMKWALTTGQTMSADLGYIPLPAEVAGLSLAALDRID